MLVKCDFTFMEPTPFAMTQGVVTSGAGPQSPLIVMQNGMLPQMTGVPYPLVGVAPSVTPFFQANYPATGLHVGEMQTTLLRGSRSPQNPEPILPKRFPSIDAYTATEVKTPKVIVSPTNLEVIHEHRLIVPEKPKVEPVKVEVAAAPPPTAIKKADDEQVEDEGPKNVAVTHPRVEEEITQQVSNAKPAVVQKEVLPDNVDDSEDFLDAWRKLGAFLHKKIKSPPKVSGITTTSPEIVSSDSEESSTDSNSNAVSQATTDAEGGSDDP